MKSLRIAIAAVALLVGGGSKAFETDITVLALVTPGTSLAFVNNNLTAMVDIWPAPNGITLSVVNNGEAILFPFSLSGTAQQQLIEATGYPAWSQRREQFQADIQVWSCATAKLDQI
jgi:hypothetical protein